MEASPQIGRNWRVKMQLKFRNLGHAERYLKICRSVLAENVSGPPDGRLGRERIRNAFCQGFGFDHYYDLQQVLRNVHEHVLPRHTAEDLQIALLPGFEIALEVARERGFQANRSAQALVSIAIDRVFNSNSRPDPY